MATLSYRDKAVAQSTVKLESGRAFLSNQLIALSNGKRLAKNMDAKASNFIKTVQALPVKDFAKSSFYYELALLVQDTAIPVITDIETLRLLVNYHHSKVENQSDWHIKLQSLSHNFDDLKFGNSFSTQIRYIYNELAIKPSTPIEFDIFIRASLSRKHSFEHTSFWLKYYIRFGSYWDMLLIEDYGVRRLHTLGYVLERHLTIKEDQLICLCEFIAAINISHHHRYLLGKALLRFFKDAYPFLEQQLGKEYYASFENNNGINTFCFWLFHNRNFHQLKEESGCLLLDSNFYKTDKSEDYTTFLITPFYKIVKYLPNFLLGNLKLVDVSLLLYLAVGKNIRKHISGSFFTKKMAHIFHNLKNEDRILEENIERYYLYCLVKSLGGNQDFFEFLSQYITIDLNHGYRFQTTLPYIKKIVEWDIFNTLNRNECQLILGYISHLLQDEPDFNIQGRTLTSFTRLAYLFNEQNIRSRNNWFNPIIWKGAAYEKWEEEIDGKVYQIIQLLTTQSLIDESAQLNHCVSGYAQQCHKNQCSIWSLQIQFRRKSWKSLVTIEINASKQIVQAKGNHNSIPKRIHLDIIKAWTKQEGLKFVRC